jgi:YggT family protein
MTTRLPKKFQPTISHLPALFVGLFGALEALLLARLLARLLAARIENPAIAALYMLSDPLIWPLAALDAGQPRFGSTLELSTLTLALCVPALAFGIWKLIAHDAQTPPR